MSRSRFFAWMLVAAILVWSCTARAVCSSRPLAAADGDARDDEPCAAGGAVAAAGSGGASLGQREIWNRRSLRDRSPWSWPPSPLWNRPGDDARAPAAAGVMSSWASASATCESFPSCVA